MNYTCAYCHKQLHCVSQQDKIIVNTVYWNVKLHEHYCNAECSLQRFNQLQKGKEDGISIEGQTQKNSTRND